MKVSIIFLDYLRHDFTDHVKRTNLHDAGHDFSLVNVDRLGIAAAINEGIHKSKGHDAIVTMSNDILMPPGWLGAMVNAAETIENTGMCGIYCVESLPPAEEINGIKVHPVYTAFGNVLIPFKAIDKVGHWNIDYDPYGMQDADYAHRLLKSGFINYYLPGLKADHIGHDAGTQSDYRKMKDEGLATAGDKWGKWTKQYEESGAYNINYPEWP